MSAFAYMRGTARDTIVTREGFNDEITQNPQKKVAHGNLRLLAAFINYTCLLKETCKCIGAVASFMGNFGLTTSIKPFLST